MALVEWMRTLRGLGAEPRLIASRLPDRPALGDSAAAVLPLLQEVRSEVAQLWTDLGEATAAVFDEGSTWERAGLSAVAVRISVLADADERSRAVMIDGKRDFRCTRRRLPGAGG